VNKKWNKFIRWVASCTASKVITICGRYMCGVFFFGAAGWSKQTDLHLWKWHFSTHFAPCNPQNSHNGVKMQKAKGKCLQESGKSLSTNSNRNVQSVCVTMA